MRSRWTLQGAGGEALSWTQLAAGGRPKRVVQPVLTVSHVCRLLHKSRRQVYRYMKAGLLVPCTRILGQWLFAPEEIPLSQRRRAPGFLKPYFWDTRLSDLSADRYRTFILGRILEFGDRRAASWALRTYSPVEIASFLQGRGKEILSKRTWHFWALLLGRGLSEHRGVSWRHRGRRWGGLP